MITKDHATRRALMAGAAALAAALALPSPAAAQGACPTRTIRVIVPFPAGGTTDIFARHIGDRLAKAFGHNFVIDNRGGAGGNIGSDAVAKAEPDGYTLLVGTVGTHAINTSLYTRMPYDPVKDFAPVAYLAGVPNIMEVNPKNVKATTVQEFIAEAKAAPKKLSFASSGNGTSIHLSGEMFKQMTGVELVHVPYRGSAPAVNDLIAGQVDVMFDNLPSSIEQVRGGNLRAIAVTSLKRSVALPEVPTIDESGLPGFDASSWFAIFAPAKTPPEIVQKLNAEVLKALADPELQKRFADIGGEIRPYKPDELAAFVKAEIEKWAKVVKTSGAKIE
jgi:tripartite-type tricarboxylate transporter receptor subunit TctC